MPKPYNVFIVYARKDAEYLEELRGHLRPMELNGTLKVWCDREIDPGVKWEDAILRNMDTADIILLMVSAAYYDSTYIHEKELKYALERHEKGEAGVIPVIVRPCDFDTDPIVSSLQILPKDAKPVTEWPNKDTAWLDVVRGIRREVGKREDVEIKIANRAQAAEDEKKRASAAEAERQRRENEEAERKHNEERKLRDEEKRRQEQAARKQQELEAMRRADNEVWGRALTDDSTESYQYYLQQHPNGMYQQEAMSRIKRLEEESNRSLKKMILILGSLIFLIILKESERVGKQINFDYPVVYIAGGTFTIGNPEVEKDISVDECNYQVVVHDFQIGKYEVTQKEWRDVMGINPSRFKDCDNCPVENVSWNDIKKFIQKLNERTGVTWRLPTEVEWEYAARGGRESNGYLYAGGDELDTLAWHNGNSSNKTHEVGGKIPNELGLYDMSGNVREWCEDWFKPYPGCNGPDYTESYRVLRGGSWSYDPLYCRVAHRTAGAPDQCSYGVGFRLARTK
jgi:hypothetical protein